MADPKIPPGLAPYNVEPGDVVVTLERDDAACGFHIPVERRAEGIEMLRLLLEQIPPDHAYEMRRWMAHEAIGTPETEEAPGTGEAAEAEQEAAETDGAPSDPHAGEADVDPTEGAEGQP